MTRPGTGLLFSLAACAGLGLIQASHAQEIGRAVILTDTQTTDVYAAGGEVDVQAAVEGDVVAAGRNVTVAGSVSADVIAAGRNVSVRGDVADDVRLAGRRVELSGPVAGHAVMAGGEVRLEPTGSVGEWAWIAARRVYIAGTVGGELKAVGRSVELNGVVNGDVELAGDRLRLGDQAVINGNLTWRGERAPRISDSAVISGETVQGEPLPEFRRPRPGLGSRLLLALSVILTAGLLYTFFRPLYQASGTLVESRPGASLATGLAVLAATPLLILILFATGIGVVLGVLLVPTYILLLLLGGLSGVILMARIGLFRFRGERSPGLGPMWLAIAGVALVLALLYLWPPLGSIVAFILMILGLGALSLEFWRRARA